MMCVDRTGLVRDGTGAGAANKPAGVRQCRNRNQGGDTNHSHQRHGTSLNSTPRRIAVTEHHRFSKFKRIWARFLHLLRVRGRPIIVKIVTTCSAPVSGGSQFVSNCLASISPACGAWSVSRGACPRLTAYDNTSDRFSELSSLLGKEIATMQVEGEDGVIRRSCDAVDSVQRTIP